MRVIMRSLTIAFILLFQNNCFALSEFDTAKDNFLKNEDKKSSELFESILKKGDYRAAVFLAYIYGDELSDLYSEEKEVYFLKIASSNGYSDSMVALAMKYRSGSGFIKQDYNVMKALLDEAADKSNPYAYLLLSEGCLISKTISCGGSEKAIEYLDFAIWKKLDDASLLKSLEWIKGISVDKNLMAAYLVLGGLARDGMPNAQYLYGEFFAKDNRPMDVGNKDDRTALFWMYLSAYQGFDLADKRIVDISLRLGSAEANAVEESVRLWLLGESDNKDRGLGRYSDFCLKNYESPFQCIKTSWVDHESCDLESEYIEDYSSSDRYKKCRIEVLSK